MTITQYNIGICRKADNTGIYCDNIFILKNLCSLWLFLVHNKVFYVLPDINFFRFLINAAIVGFM